MYKKFLSISRIVLFGAILFFGCATDNEKSEVVATNIKTVKIDIQGMTCSGCEFGVETALKKVDGVKQAEASFDKKSAEVEFDPSVAKVDQLVEAVNQAGFKAKTTNLN